MNRAGILSIVLAAAVTGACGGAENGSASPTGPSNPTTSSSQPQPSAPASCVPQNLSVASIQGSVVTLQWSPVNGATEYTVLVGAASGSSDLLSTNTSNTNYSWTARPGRQYARVQAKCGSYGSSSNEVEFTVAGSSAD